MSECGCIYLGVDCDNEFESQCYRTARKEHRCCECKAVIRVGQQYEVRAHKSDGAMSSFKTCLPCAEIRLTFCCDGWYYGRLWEDVEDQMFGHGGLNSACLDKLVTVEAKQFLQRQWMQWVDEQTSSTEGRA